MGNTVYRLFTILIAIFQVGLFSTYSLAASPIRIGLSLGLSGDYALTSNKQKNAYALFEETINASGGVLGRPLKFIIKDNQSKPSIAVAQYEALITKDKVDFVIAPYTSGLTMAISPVVEKYGYPTLAAGAAADRIWQQGFKNIFGLWTPASRYSLGFLKLLTYYQLNGIVIASADEPFGMEIASGAQKWAKTLHLNVLDFITFKEGQTHLDDIARQVATIKPQILLCTGHYSVGVNMKKALNKIGWHPRVFYATVSPNYQKYYDDFQQMAELDLSTSIWEPHPKLGYPGSQDFAKRYELRYGSPPTYHAATAYAAAEVLVKAITQANSTDKDSVRHQLQTMNTMSIIGRYAVDKTGIQIKRFPLVVQWQKGKKEIVWPLELQTAPAMFRDTE